MVRCMEPLLRCRLYGGGTPASALLGEAHPQCPGALGCLFDQPGNLQGYEQAVRRVEMLGRGRPVLADVSQVGKGQMGAPYLEAR